MANQEQLDLLTQGVEVWNQWRQGHPDIQPDLRQANLIKALQLHLFVGSVLSSQLEVRLRS